jgi:Transmembrane protein of unknown function (DUF3556)
MGFTTPAPPPFDVEEWKRRPHLERIKPLAQDWALNGFGTPVAVYFLYLIKLVLYAGGGLLVIAATTPGLGGLGDLGAWWTQPIVFQKAVIWTMLWEVLGIGAGSLPLTLRFSPMIGGLLYWLRPGTTRLPPWPEKVPLTAGTRRTVFDVALYAGLIAAALDLLLSGGIDASAGAAGRLDPLAVGVLLAVLVALGLRDKVPFLAARAEVYGNLAIIFLFPLGNMIVAAQLVFVCIWWGAASSKLNRHFPFVVTVMVSNTPWNASRTVKRRLWRHHPDDLLPSRAGALAAHLGTVTEYTLPLLLLVSGGGVVGTIAVAGMILFHLHILSTFPLGVPLEWNVFMIFGLLFLFGHYGSVPFSTLEDPLLIAILAVSCIGFPVLGNFRPDLISFLPSMRYYAGNWAASQWLFRKDSGAERKLDRSIVKSAPVAVEQLTKFYDRETAELLMCKGLAFRSMHAHGRAINGLLPRAVEDVEDYHVREGEVVAGVVLGYNFGDGHFHNHRLLEAVQERCGFEEGELRVIVLESQPAHLQRQRYRILDAATGVVEEGWVEVAEMVSRQPWLGEEPFPVRVAAAAGEGPTAAAAPPA